MFAPNNSWPFLRIKQHIWRLILRKLKLVWPTNFPLCYIPVVKAEPNRRILFQVSDVAYIVPSSQTTPQMHYECIELVLTQIFCAEEHVEVEGEFEG